MDGLFVRLICLRSMCCCLLAAGAVGCESDSPTEPGPDPDTPAWVDIALGEAHACGLRNDGAVFCWGDNSHHQVSPDTAPTVSAPVQVALGFSATDVEAGGPGSCARDESGRYHCWGRNVVSQLAVPGDTLLEVPTPMTGPIFQSIAIGAIHSCGTTGSGQVYCWGGGGGVEGRDKATGSPLTTVCRETRAYLSDRCSPTPTVVALPEPADIVGTGVFFTCALGRSGTSYCWGYDAWGGLGVGGELDPDPAQWGRYDAVPVSGGLRFADLSVGNVYTCGLDQAGAAFCWGADFPNGAFGMGRLGSGRPWQDGAARAPIPVTGGLRFASIVATAENSTQAGHTCALTDGGALFCWGANEFGQLGVSTASSVCWQDKPCHTAPVQVDAGQRSSVRLGMYHTCSLTTMGLLHCWGRNDEGQLGVGDLIDRPSPTPVPLPVS